MRSALRRGKKRAYEPADPDGFKIAVEKIRENVTSSFASQMIGILGTSGALDKYNSEGELPIKYWTLGTWDEAFNISGATASEKIFKRCTEC